MELIDVHSHILPHMDHGSIHVAMSMAQVELLHRAGTHTVCATSHFYPQQILAEDFLKERKESFACMMEALGDRPRPRIILGAEVLICDGMEHLEELDELCFEGTRVLLLEMPLSPRLWTQRAYDTVRHIRDRGITPLLAHVDRYPADFVAPLLRDGVKGQVNTDALCGWRKPRHLFEWMDRDYVVALGGDLHGDKPRRYKSFPTVAETMPDRTAAIMQATEELLKDAVRR